MNDNQQATLQKIGQQMIALLRDRSIQLADDDYERAWELLLMTYQRLEEEHNSLRQALREIVVIAQGQTRATPSIIKPSSE